MHFLCNGRPFRTIVMPMEKTSSGRPKFSASQDVFILIPLSDCLYLKLIIEHNASCDFVVDITNLSENFLQWVISLQTFLRYVLISETNGLQK